MLVSFPTAFAPIFLPWMIGSWTVLPLRIQSWVSPPHVRLMLLSRACYGFDQQQHGERANARLRSAVCEYI